MRDIPLESDTEICSSDRESEHMVYFAFLFPTSKDRALKAILIRELRAQVLPLLQSLGFQIFRARENESDGFPTRYYRTSPNHIDVIHFVWMKRGEPAFIIDFDVIDDLTRFPS